MHAVVDRSDYRIKPDSVWSGLWKKTAALGIVGLVVSAVGLGQDPKRFAYSYLFAFFAFLTLGLGSLFFVMIQYITKAGWSVSVRRTAEFFMSGLPIFAVLVIPVLISMGTLYGGWLGGHEGGHEAQAAQSVSHGAVAKPSDHSHAVPTTHGPAVSLEERNARAVEDAKHKQHAALVHGKAGYLNKSFFLIRVAFYALVWIFLSMRFFRWSTEQDVTKSIANTLKAQQFAPIGLMLFAVTLTFAGVDWLMSLEPSWYSTMFGVYLFAGRMS